MYFAAKPVPPPKKKLYLTLFRVVMKYLSTALNSKDYASVLPNFCGASLLTFRQDPVKKRFPEEASVSGFCRGMSNKKCPLIFSKK